jgi:hypothetical protein
VIEHRQPDSSGHDPAAITLRAMPDDSRAGDPQNWRIDVPQAHIDLYLELLTEPRALRADEARMMVELVNGWRSLEQRKHIALKSAEDDTSPRVE